MRKSHISIFQCERLLTETERLLEVDLLVRRSLAIEERPPPGLETFLAPKGTLCQFAP